MSTREDDFHALYTATYPAVARYCWTLTQDRELSHDLAQEAFTRVLARWVRVEDPRAYVFRVATNLARKTWRSNARAAATAERLAGLPVAGEHDGHAELLGLRTAVEQLPRRLRDVVLLHYFADLSVAEAGAALGRPSGTVKRQLAEARALLAGALEVPDA